MFRLLACLFSKNIFKDMFISSNKFSIKDDGSIKKKIRSQVRAGRKFKGKIKNMNR